MFVTLYETVEVHFCLLGTNRFHVKVKNERFTAAGLYIVRTLNMKMVQYVKHCTEKRAARAARSFFLIQPINLLIVESSWALPSSGLELHNDPSDWRRLVGNFVSRTISDRSVNQWTSFYSISYVSCLIFIGSCRLQKGKLLHI